MEGEVFIRQGAIVNGKNALCGRLAYRAGGLGEEGGFKVPWPDGTSAGF